MRLLDHGSLFFLSSPQILKALYDGCIPSVADIVRPQYWPWSRAQRRAGRKFLRNGNIDVFHVLASLSKRYIVTEHSKLYIRTQRFWKWQQLRGATCTLPILAAIAKCRSMPTRLRLLQPLIARKKAFSFPEGFSETHLHIKAYTYPEELWLTALHQPVRTSEVIGLFVEIHKDALGLKLFATDDTRVDDRIGTRVFRCLVTARCIRENLIDALAGNNNGKSLLAALLDTISKTDLCIRGIPYTARGRMEDLDRHGPDGLWEEESRMWLQAFAAVKQYESCRIPLAALLHLYLLLENYMSVYFRGESKAKGLEKLKPVYSIHGTMPEEYHDGDGHALRRLQNDTQFSGGNQIEVRMSKGEWEKRRGTFPANSQPAAIVDGRPVVSPSWRDAFHTSVHLIKSAYLKKSKAKSLTAMMKDSRNEASNIIDLITKGGYPCLRLDAAGATLDVPPETLAPAFRRSSEHLKGKTFHCGEDFRHLISGIREVADSIRVLSLGEGDCVGHAVSIGIAPEKWIRSQVEEINIPRHEWLMDLLYLLETTQRDFPSSVGAWQLAEARKQWETDALHYALSLFPNCAELRQEGALQLLHRLYENCHLFAPCLETGSPAETGSLDESELQMIEQARLANTAGLQDLLAEWNEICPTKQEMVAIPRDYLPAGVLLRLQQQVQRTIQEKGIVVEVCLVSNCKISDYKDLGEHHISRWLNLRGCAPAGDSRMRLCMGCDDPGIFVTNTANEYYHLICLLLQRGFSPRIIRRIISRLIRQGNCTLRGR